MTPGTFLFDDDFTFHDGAIGEKIFVVLNDGTTGIYVAVKTTSRGDRFGISYGCQILDRFPNFYFVKGSCCLTKDTWVQLDSFYEFDASDLMTKVVSGEIKRIGVMDSGQAVDFLVCSTHAEDLSSYQEGVINEALAGLR